MSYSSQVLDHPSWLKNALYFNVFSYGAGVREEENTACIGRFVQICSSYKIHEMSVIRLHTCGSRF